MEKLVDTASPSLDTAKMQVYFDMNYTTRSRSMWRVCVCVCLCCVSVLCVCVCVCVCVVCARVRAL